MFLTTASFERVLPADSGYRQSAISTFGNSDCSFLPLISWSVGVFQTPYLDEMGVCGAYGCFYALL